MRGGKTFGFALILMLGWAMGLLTRFHDQLVFRVDGLIHKQGHILDKGTREPQDGHHYDQESRGHVTTNQYVSSPHIPVFPTLWFPRSSASMSRRKRDWVIPPINFPENDRGPFPKTIVQIRSSNAKKMEITYSITGPGADKPPEGIFTIDKRSGMLFVTMPMDRERKSSYMLLAHATAVGIGQIEEPMELVIHVTDQNDNKPEFTQNPVLGQVTEGALPDTTFMRVTAEDKDDPSTDNGIIRYKIVNQEPKLPGPNMFTINAVSGLVSVAAAGLDRETFPQYKLVIQAADMEGNGLSSTCTAVIAVTDRNDNAPQFVNSTYSGSVNENVNGELVLKMAATDKDEPHTTAWSMKYSIIRGNEGELFSVRTDPVTMEGLITTAKGLDFENKNSHTLLVTVENTAPFVISLPTSTATVIVSVEDVNEAPVFMPVVLIIKVSEGLAVGSDMTEYLAKDPDTAMKQTVRFQIADDPAKWLKINRETGHIKVKHPMDRESSFVKDGKYKAIIIAYDDAQMKHMGTGELPVTNVAPATGTGTLIIGLDDVNDNPPLVEQRAVSVCNQRPDPVHLTVIDADGPGNTGPFDLELLGETRNNWTAKVNSTSGSVIDLTLKRRLEPGTYNVVLRIYDAGMHFQESTILAEVCECKGRVSTCVRHPPSPYTGGPVSIGVLGAIFGILLLALLLLMFLRRRNRPIKAGPLLHDDVRDNLYYYDEEGGGEEDQEYDLSQLHRGLDNRPSVFRNDVVPTLVPEVLYRPRPGEAEEIGNFIEENLKAADGDPTAPPYDSLLVFDYEGDGSEAGSLSSLNSSSSGDQDYACLADWGPRFRKLADMYCSGEYCDSDTLPSKVAWV